MEVDDLHASDDLRAKLLALQANAAETPGAKSIAMPAPSPTPKKQKKPLRFPARRWAQLAACAAVCGVCLYGAVPPIRIHKSTGSHPKIAAWIGPLIGPAPAIDAN